MRKLLVIALSYSGLCAQIIYGGMRLDLNSSLYHQKITSSHHIMAYLFHYKMFGPRRWNMYLL